MGKLKNPDRILYTDPEGNYVDENLTPGEEIKGTIYAKYWANQINNEINNLILKSGQTPSETDLEQIYKAVGWATFIIDTDDKLAAFMTNKDSKAIKNTRALIDYSRVLIINGTYTYAGPSEPKTNVSILGTHGSKLILNITTGGFVFQGNSNNNCYANDFEIETIGTNKQLDIFKNFSVDNITVTNSKLVATNILTVFSNSKISNCKYKGIAPTNKIVADNCIFVTYGNIVEWIGNEENSITRIIKDDLPAIIDNNLDLASAKAIRSAIDNSSSTGIVEALPNTVPMRDTIGAVLSKTNIANKESIYNIDLFNEINKLIKSTIIVGETNKQGSFKMKPEKFAMPIRYPLKVEWVSDTTYPVLEHIIQVLTKGVIISANKVITNPIKITVYTGQVIELTNENPIAFISTTFIGYMTSYDVNIARQNPFPDRKINISISTEDSITINEYEYLVDKSDSVQTIYSCEPNSSFLAFYTGEYAKGYPIINMKITTRYKSSIDDQFHSIFLGADKDIISIDAKILHLTKSGPQVVLLPANIGVTVEVKTTNNYCFIDAGSDYYKDNIKEVYYDIKYTITPFIFYPMKEAIPGFTKGGAAGVNDILMFAIGGDTTKVITYTINDILSKITPVISTPLSISRNHSTGVSCRNLVFFAGGIIWTAASGYGSHVSNVDIYNDDDKSWSVNNLSSARSSIGATSCRNLVFFAGGITNSGIVDTIDIYDTDTNTFSVSSHRLTEPKSDIGATSCGNLVFFAGGQLANGELTDEIEVYNIDTDEWSLMHLSEKKSMIATESCQDLVFFATGFMGADILASNVVEIYNIKTKEMTIKTFYEGYSEWDEYRDYCYPVGFKGFAAASTSSKVFFTGGEKTLLEDGKIISGVTGIACYYDMFAETMNMIHTNAYHIYGSMAATKNYAIMIGRESIVTDCKGEVFFDAGYDLKKSADSGGIITPSLRYMSTSWSAGNHEYTIPSETEYIRVTLNAATGGGGGGAGGAGSGLAGKRGGTSTFDLGGDDEIIINGFGGGYGGGAANYGNSDKGAGGGGGSAGATFGGAGGGGGAGRAGYGGGAGSDGGGGGGSGGDGAIFGGGAGGGGGGAASGNDGGAAGAAGAGGAGSGGGYGGGGLIFGSNGGAGYGGAGGGGGGSGGTGRGIYVYKTLTIYNFKPSYSFVVGAGGAGGRGGNAAGGGGNAAGTGGTGGTGGAGSITIDEYYYDYNPENLPIK